MFLECVSQFITELTPQLKKRLKEKQKEKIRQKFGPSEATKLKQSREVSPSGYLGDEVIKHCPMCFIILFGREEIIDMGS